MVAILVLLLLLLTIIITGLVLIVKILLSKIKRKKEYDSKRGIKMTLFVLVGLIVVSVGLVGFTQLFAKTPPIKDENGKVLSNSIAELKKIDLNGRKQYISIRGKNKDNPVLLFLAGGPGGSQMAAVRYDLAELENYFVVVNWDQPGSGKSYFSVSRKDLTVDTYIEDGYALTNYLRKEFNQDKIYLIGESWGSALGIFMADKHPECYHAFIGTGQMVDFVETEVIDYNKAIEMAEQNGDAKKLAKLKANGEPPYYGKDVTWKSAEYLNYLGDYMVHNPEISNSGYATTRDLGASEYGIMDKITYLLGIVNTFNHVYPQLYKTDLRENYNSLQIPVYFFVGKHDINAPLSLAEDYYNKLNAPAKEIVWFEHSGHNPWRNESKKFVEEVLKKFN